MRSINHFAGLNDLPGYLFARFTVSRGRPRRPVQFWRPPLFKGRSLEISSKISSLLVSSSNFCFFFFFFFYLFIYFAGKFARFDVAGPINAMYVRLGLMLQPPLRSRRNKREFFAFARVVIRWAWKLLLINVPLGSFRPMRIRNKFGDLTRVCARMRRTKCRLKDLAAGDRPCVQYTKLQNYNS